MSFSLSYLVVPLFVVFMLQPTFAVAQIQVPACSLNCTLAVLEPAGCEVTDVASIRSCLCTNNTLQTELTLCVFASCSQADQIVASEILQNEICVGVPHDSRKAEILRVEILIAAFAFPVIALRFVSRIVVARRVWWDDWMIVICALFMVPNTAIPIYTTYLGLGVHVWNVPVLNTIKLNLLYFIASIFYAIIQNMAKFSILFLYLRIFPTRSFRRIVKLAIAWQLCNMIAFTITVIFQCLPVEAFWELSMERKCMNINAVTKAGAFISIFEDLIIMVLPISELKGLNLNLRKRIALCFMFALGSFACVTSMIRLKYVWNYTLSLDGTWNYIEIVLWSDIETYLAVICSCLMCIRPLILKVFPSIFTSTNTSSSSPSQRASRLPNCSRFLSPLNSRIRSSKMMNMSAGSSRMTRLEDEGDGGESGRTIIIQGNNESERNLQGALIEMEERGVTPSTSGWSEHGGVVSVEDIGVNGDGKQ